MVNNFFLYLKIKKKQFLYRFLDSFVTSLSCDTKIAFINVPFTCEYELKSEKQIIGVDLSWFDKYITQTWIGTVSNICNLTIFHCF